MTTPPLRDSDASDSNASVAATMSPKASACAKADGRSGDTTPGTRKARPIKRKLCRMRIGRSASVRCSRRRFGQVARFATTPHAMKEKATLAKKQSCGNMSLSSLLRNERAARVCERYGTHWYRHECGTMQYQLSRVTA